MDLEQHRSSVIVWAAMLAEQWDEGNQGWLVACLKNAVKGFHEALDEEYAKEKE